MRLIILLLALEGGVKGPTLVKTTPQLYENSHLLILLADTIDTRLPYTLEGNSTHRFVVKFDHPLTAQDRSILENAGFAIEGYLPHYAYIVTGELKAVQNLLDDQIISWTSSLKPEWKIAPVLTSGQDHPDTLHVLLFPDADVEKTVHNIEDGFDAVVHSFHDGINKTLMLTAAKDRILEIAALDEVRWIEPFYPLCFHNDQAQWVLQSWEEENRTLWDRGLNGQGVVVSTGDAGITTDHVMFRDSNVAITDWGDYPGHRKVIAYQPSAPRAVFGDIPPQYHGTHTAGTVCGDDSYWEKTSPYDGIALKAKLYFIDVGTSSSIAYPEDYNDMYDLPWKGNQAGRARLMSNSWGTSNPSYRLYTLPCRQTDEFMWNHPDFCILFSAGNFGSSGVVPPSTSKNVVSVGATLNGSSADIPAGFSSVGQTEDGRIKPTLVAPGQTLISAHGGTLDGYHGLYGTSMSCPAVAGACALIVQYLQEGWYPSGSPTFNPADSIKPSAALLKAMLISSTIADFSDNPIPDPKVGWGRVSLDSVLYFAGEENRLYIYDDTCGIHTGYEAVYGVDVDGADWPLRVTLVWTDPPGDLAAEKKIVNDLDLVATSPSGNLYKGNVFQNNFSTEGGNKDDTNVEECLRIKNPDQGTWTIKVSGANVPLGPQPYALVVGGMIDFPRYSLIAGRVRVDDSQNPESNSSLDPGEQALLFPSIINAGRTTVQIIKVELASEDPLVTVLGSESDYGSIAPDQAAEGEGFEVKLDSAAQPGENLAFTVLVRISNPAGEDTVIFPILVKASAILEDFETKKPSLSCPTIVSKETRVVLSLEIQERVNLALYDASGRLLQRIAADAILQAGDHTFTLKPGLANGVYFLVLSTGKYKERLKIVHLR
jgi:hypothetical protein